MRRNRSATTMNRTIGVLIALLTVFSLALPAVVAAQTYDPSQPTGAEIESARKQAFMGGLAAGRSKMTANQTEYDVLYYALDLTLDHVADLVSGTVSMRATPTGSAITEVDVNLLDNMTVSAVAMNGSGVSYSHSGDLLTVTLDASYAAGDTFTVDITYSGLPNGAVGAFGFNNYLGKPMIWSLSEPYGARSWWPCKDWPWDKPDSVDFYITVDTSLVVASNGLLRDSLTVGSQRTWHWHEGYPIATYLVSVAAYPYATITDWYHYGVNDSMPIQGFAFPNNVSTVSTYNAMSADMIAHFSDIYGVYPFIDEKYGHAEFLWGGAMEHQTCTSMGFWGESVTAHELSHQWFGDQVTNNTFNHIWLHEGFATYSEALWNEFKYGRSAFKTTMKNTRYFGAGTIYVDDLSDWDRIFDSNLSYNKGSWVVHMLRHVVGDSTFFDICKTYLDEVNYGYASATTEEFQAICESVSGMDLDDFFQEWIYDEYYPIYSYEWSKTPGGGGWDIDLTINQKQTHRLFNMPIDVKFTTAGGNTTLVVRDSLAVQNFSLHIENEPTKLELDKALWILRGLQEEVVDPTFDRGILVVNGVSWDSYGSEIVTAYQDSVFWGDNPIAFWDCFSEPSGGYPANLPAPLGHNEIPADTLKQFSTVVWVGNNYDGDLVNWVNTSIQDYLEAGGNVVLLCRMGHDFIHTGLTDYLGVDWGDGAYVTLGDYTAVYPGLVSQALTGTQSFVHVTDQIFAQPETELLFKDNSLGGDYRATGVYRAPAGGGTHRANGGRFAYLAGRPYRMNHDQLRANVEFILDNLMLEPFDPTDTAGSPAPKPVYALAQNRPNPFNPITNISYSIPAKEDVTLRIYSPAGRLVKTLVDGTVKAGDHTVTWDGRDDRGHETASGIYFYRLDAGQEKKTKKMVLLR